MPSRACIINNGECTGPAITGTSRCSAHRRGGGDSSAYDAQHQAIAKDILARADHCAICGGPPTASDPLQADHIIPLSQGGRTVRANYQATHRSCNIRKGGANRFSRKT